MEGWVKLHRSLLSSKVWFKSNEESKVLMITLLLKAVFVETDWNYNNVQLRLLPGQVACSRNSLANELNITAAKVRKALETLIDLGFIEKTYNKKCSVFSIKNWSKYQLDDNQANSQANSQVDSQANDQLNSQVNNNSKDLETVDCETNNKSSDQVNNQANDQANDQANSQANSQLNKNIYNNNIYNNKIYNKKNNNKKNKTAAVTEVLQKYHHKFGMLSPVAIQGISEYADTLGSEVVDKAYEELCAAQERCERDNSFLKRPDRYWIKILDTWEHSKAGSKPWENLPGELSGIKTDMDKLYEELEA